MIKYLIFINILKYLDMITLLKLYKLYNLKSNIQSKILLQIKNIEKKNVLFWKNNYKKYIIYSLFDHIDNNKTIVENEPTAWPTSMINLITLNINYNKCILRICLDNEFNNYNIDQIILMFKNYNEFSLFNDKPPYELPFLKEY
jgi:hypothetical protein